MRARTRGRGNTGLYALMSPLLVLACGDGVTDVPPQRTGQLEVSTVSIGSAIDADGYEVVFNGEGSQAIDATGSVTVSDISVGQYDVELTDLSTSCHVLGENPQSVSVKADETTSVAFNISCPPYHDYISYFGDQGGWLVKPDGSDAVNLSSLTSDRVGAGWWSRDATRMVFSRGGIETAGIYIVDMSDLSERRVTIAGGCPCSWSPDDSRLLYTLVTGDLTVGFTVDVYSINTDGSDSRLLTPEPGRAYDAAWSPDGSRIAFIWETPFRDIWLMDPDGSNKVKLTDLASAVAPPLIPIAYEPAWSPDGTRIAFAGPGEFSGPRIWVVNSDGSNLTMLTAAPFSQAWHPSWSPDGARITFWGRQGGEQSPLNTYEIYVMNADGSNVVNITNSPGSETGPSWSW